MAEELVFSGRVWLFGDSVDTDQILPGYAMAYPREQLKGCAMAGSPRPNFAAEVSPGDIIVAGGNFGCGSSREQAPLALKDAGVALVIAASFARIFRRNAINIGLPVLQVDLGGRVEDGDIVAADVSSAQVVLPDGSRINGQVPGENVIAVLAAGGLINKVRRQLAKERG
ncbi:MAG: 3-isopropylmalate dehydratase [Negativicutes bacterium]|nr:3-isopropylmalate dehydratase [Negativicutes bacterium]